MFRKKLFVFPLADQLRDLGVRIVQIAPEASATGTKFHACWIFSLGSALIAESTLFYNMLLVRRDASISRSEIDRVLRLLPIERANTRVRTSRHAHATTYALVVILSNNPRIRILVRCTHRANLHTRRIIAVLA